MVRRITMKLEMMTMMATRLMTMIEVADFRYGAFE
jgi:hypothetical protein